MTFHTCLPFIVKFTVVKHVQDKSVPVISESDESEGRRWIICCMARDNLFLSYQATECNCYELVMT